MADSSTNLEVLEKRIVDEEPSQVFNDAIHDLNSRFRVYHENPGENVKIGEILDIVSSWEKATFEKFTDEEIESLEVLSLVLESINLRMMRQQSPADIEFANKQMIETQRDAVRVTFRNLDKDGLPNERILASFGLITCVFEKALMPKPDRFYEPGLEGQVTFWQGVLGMVTAAQMFDRIGWDVRIPPVELDLRYDTDFIVRDPDGKVYSVDVTASVNPKWFPGENEGRDLFCVEKRRAAEEVVDKIEDVSGGIRINVPPLRTPQSEDFYDPMHRKAGVPSESTLAKFKRLLS